MSLFLDYLRSLPIYQELCAVHDSDEGNTLELVDDTTAEAQVEFHRWALGLVRANNSNSVNTLEIGTNKGMFGLLLWQVDPLAGLYTIDVNSRAGDAARLLNHSGLDVEFECGDSAVILPVLKYCGKHFNYAWVDGHHGCDEALADLMGCDRLKISWVAVDDTVYETVATAIERWLAAAPYEEVLNPFLEHDTRKARLYRRK
jgi:prepilin-type processing-associated H-X9-DG protein